MSLVESCGSGRIACSTDSGPATCAPANDMDGICADADSADWSECQCSVACEAGWAKQAKDPEDENSDKFCVDMSNDDTCGDKKEACGDGRICANPDSLDDKCDTVEEGKRNTCICAKKCDAVSGIMRELGKES